MSTDLGFEGEMTNGVDTREVSWPQGGGMQQINIVGNNITLTLSRDKGHISGVKYEKYEYTLDTDNPDSLNMTINANAVSFSGHLRFEDEELLEELEDIGFENIIMFTGM